MKWHMPDSPPFRLSGFPWYEQEGVYRRLPSRPPWQLPDAVDRLANSTAGGQIAFRSDATQVAVRVELPSPADMNHMPDTGQCGFDLYIGTPPGQRYHNTTKYNHRQRSGRRGREDSRR